MSAPTAGHIQDENESYKLIIVIALFLPIATILVLLRLYVRRNITHSLGIDDALMVFALVRVVTL